MEENKETPKLETAQELERKKKKKEDKAKEKELKKSKALEKAAAQKLASATASKKSEKKLLAAAKKDEENPEDDYADPPTNPGEKKHLSDQMAKQYNPAAVEKAWYAWWEKSGYFTADATSTKPATTIILPPPNVTGKLHINVRDNVCWVPGMDHAGIATQVVVEKKLMREKNQTRHDIGREEFEEMAWDWTHEYGGEILCQFRRLGVSLDWSRQCFTMDEQRTKAVNEAFVRLYKDRLIYRGNRLVHWDCALRTAISDMEVDYQDIQKKTELNVPGYDSPVEFGVLTSFAYRLEEEDLGEIVVATTRLETMLGDTGIAVHPEDERYSHLHGKFAIHPFSGRRLPIVCDEILVDPKFGTGAVKITPAHDLNDFECGKRHRLDFINILTDDGLINGNGGEEFEGMPRFKARVAVAEALKLKGLYRDAQNNVMQIGVCSRTNEVVEPMMKPQWYVKCNGMAKKALDAVVDENCKKIEIIPKQYTAEWRRWLENSRDWCISRQLWWGHRVPAWYVTLEDDINKEYGAYADHWVVGINEKEALSEANRIFAGKQFQMGDQDPDVLDTWFSSGIFPLSALGWPDDTADFRAFYPTTVLETGHDILFFWVARMVMLGMQLSGDVPFKKVYLHQMVRDAHGRKMSKSLGNVIDPLEVINGQPWKTSTKGWKRRWTSERLPKGIAECGADALRFALLSYTGQSDKINLDIKRVVRRRQWCNKLWNVIRFAMTNLGDNYVPPTSPLNLESLPFSCKWILSVLNKAISKTVAALESYEFSDASKAVKSWWKSQLCDVFIEAIKPYFAGDDEKFKSERCAARDTLWICLDNGLRLLHPFMPYITEELWQRLPGTCPKKESIMISEYPSAVMEWTNKDVESDMVLVDKVVSSFSKVCAGLPPNERLCLVVCKTADGRDVIRSREFEISTLSALSSLEILADNDDAKLSTCLVDVADEHISTYVHQLQGSSLEKLLKQKDEIQKMLDSMLKMMSTLGYLQKTPRQIQEKNVEKLDKLRKQLNDIYTSIHNIFTMKMQGN
ncbi:hypothetical protein MKW92_049673 [Papaver armeniacum]|nr:hypothetical protein MKW92_049673 [Papaver armeniacum]